MCRLRGSQGFGCKYNCWKQLNRSQCISGFLLKNSSGLDQLWFGSVFLEFSISGFFLKNFCGLDQLWSKRISIFFHFWIFFKELLWFGIWVQKDVNFPPFLDFLKRTFVVWDFHFLGFQISKSKKSKSKSKSKIKNPILLNNFCQIGIFKMSKILPIWYF